MPTPEQVPAEPKPTGVATATPGAGSPVAKPATPATPAVDAELARLQRENQRLTQDINRMKSTFQSRESQLSREAKARERELNESIRKAQMAGMDDDARKIYEVEIANEQMAELQEQMNELAQANAQLEAKQRAYEYFRQIHVPSDVVNLGQSLDEMTEAGYQWLAQAAQELTTLKAAQVSTPAPAAPVTPTPTPAAAPAPAALPQAPRPDLGAGAIPGARPTWGDIDKEWADKGGREAFYLGLQNGEVSSDRLPMHEEPPQQ